MRLPPGSDPDDATFGYVNCLKGLPIAAIEAGILRFLRGECQDVSPKFCPYPPELARICRTTVYAPMPRRDEARGYVPAVQRVPFMERIERKKREFAHRAVLFEHLNYDQFRHLSRAGQIPVGGQWVASLGTVYGPEPRP